MNFFTKFFSTRKTLAERVEELLVGHFTVYWHTHPSTDEQRQQVIALIQERISMTTPDVLRDILDPRIPRFKSAGILDKIVNRVYVNIDGNSVFFLRLLTRE